MTSFDPKRLVFRSKSCEEADVKVIRAFHRFSDQRWFRFETTDNDIFDVPLALLVDSSVLVNMYEMTLRTRPVYPNHPRPTNAPTSPLRNLPELVYFPITRRPIQIPFNGYIFHAMLWFLLTPEENRRQVGFPVLDLIQIYEIGDFLNMESVRREVLALMEQYCYDENNNRRPIQEIRRLFGVSGDDMFPEIETQASSDDDSSASIASP